MQNRELYIDCDGMKVHAKLDFPEGDAKKLPLMVLIPGLTGHIEERHILAVSAAANRAGVACLRAELYGHGLSDGDFYDHTILKWMNQAMCVVDYAGRLDFVTNLYLAGHSQGGLTAVLAGGMMADKLTALIPLSPAMVIPDLARKGEAWGVKLDMDDMPENFLLFGKRPASTNYIRAARVLPIEPCIHLFKKPVLIVHGTEDTTVPYSYGRDLAGKYADARLVSISGDDHVYTYHLDAAAQAVQDFLEDCERHLPATRS